MEHEEACSGKVSSIIVPRVCKEDRGKGCTKVSSSKGMRSQEDCGTMNLYAYMS